MVLQVVLNHYSLRPNMIVLLPRVFYSKMFVWGTKLREVGQSFWDGGSIYENDNTSMVMG